MKSFEQSSYVAQVFRLRKLAKEALKRFPVKVKSIDFIHHGENATFKITDAKNKNYMLRIHRANYNSYEAIHEELKWLEDISKTTQLKVPKPLRSKNKNLIETVVTDGILTPRKTCLFHWIDGYRVYASVSPKHMYMIGQTIGDLQHNTINKKVKHRNYWSADGLIGLNPRLGKISNLLTASKANQSFINKERARVFKIIKAYETKYPKKMGLIHADMHFGNVIFTKDDIGVIDFDDSGYGAFLYDLAVPLIMIEDILRKKKKLKHLPYLKEALFIGYASKMPFNKVDEEMVSYYQKARKLAMLGWIQSRADNPRLKAMQKQMIIKAVKYLKEK